MAIGSGSYLTPDWLMQSPHDLLKRTGASIGGMGSTMLSEDEFKTQHQGGYYTKGFSNAPKGYFYDFDFGDYNPGRSTYADERGILGGVYGATAGQHFTSEEDAYAAYKQAMESRDIASGGETLGYEAGNIFTDSFAEGVGRAKGEDVLASAYESFNPEQFQKLRTEYYQKDIEEGRESLIDSLISKQHLAKAKGSGIAGYGRRTKAVEDVGERYEAGVGDIYADVGQKRKGALQDIYDTMGQYENIGA